LSQYTRLTDKQTDGQNYDTDIVRCIPRNGNETSLPKVIWEEGSVAAKVSDGAV